VDLRTQIKTDHDRFLNGLPPNLEDYILATYGISLESTYAGQKIKNPFGKASGQLSLNIGQIERDAEAGLGFVVLKTLIAQDASGGQSMKAWAIPEAKMTVERIKGVRERVRDVEGWTVTWKGRGWSGTLKDYLEFFDKSLAIGSGHQMLVVPSCKYHLISPTETEWRIGEYNYTTEQLLAVWRAHNNSPMPIEKDFSPTLAGDDHFSKVQETILRWLEVVPSLVRAGVPAGSVMVGLKIFNAMYEDAFQLTMLEACANSDSCARPDYLVYGNRLFDPRKVFEGKQGVAYGGPDLSDRNLKILSIYASLRNRLPVSATGNITTGREAFEYLKRGATSFQMHTLFQLPDSEFAMQAGTRVERALHKLLFDPISGFLQSWIEAKEQFGWSDAMDIPTLARTFAP
jgi:dihydroorotate dehydrogenase